MARDPRYDILFEPVAIGPVTARNRFYQVPHCCGMGHGYPSSNAAMRGVKAEGGWAVVCTEEVEIHPTSDISPYFEGRLWDERDIPTLARIAEAIKTHGALAGIELAHNGASNPCRFSRTPPYAPSSHAIFTSDPVQPRVMDKADIKAVRRWHRDAMLRARQAGYDLIYVYAAHDLSLFMHFLNRRTNHRSDEYGGSLENRVRLLREVLEDSKEAVGDSCAIALRFAVEELLGDDGITSAGEGREVVEMLAELPDLWDVNVSDWANDSVPSRFGREGAQEEHVSFVKAMTSKPVVGVGRFTSPDTMVSQIKRGVLDMIGAARPSIADPFLPRKIEEGRPEEIRECIGCNICVSGDFTQVPMRCTQNPTMGEEWRRGWHPERIAPKGSDSSVLVVGAGPAGLECARALGQRGYAVTLAEAGEELGGRVTRESRLPGLAEWARVRDYRVGRLNEMANVEIYRASRLTAETVAELGAAQVVIATGAKWRRDGMGRRHRKPIPGSEAEHVVAPDAVIDGMTPDGPVLVYDDDHYYMGAILAEKLRRDGHEVCLVTPAADVSTWTHNTMEQARTQTLLLELGVEIVAQHALVAIAPGEVELACVFTGRTTRRACAAVVPVTARIAEDGLYHDLMADSSALDAAGVRGVTRIGDCLAPGTIAAAVHGGHHYARTLDAPEDEDRPFEREVPALSADWPRSVSA